MLTSKQKCFNTVIFNLHDILTPLVCVDFKHTTYNKSIFKTKTILAYIIGL